jgi:hypothetical protein
MPWKETDVMTEKERLAKKGVTEGVTPIFHDFRATNPPHRPEIKGHCWLPEFMC